jgi:serine/threonine protein kinase
MFVPELAALALPSCAGKLQGQLLVAEQCKQCGKSLTNTRAGSFTSYLFQQNYCQCNKSKSGRQGKSADKARSSGASSIAKNQSQSQVCTNCGKSVAKKRAGSFTSFLFQELRCQCAQPALPKKLSSARTNTQVRRQAMAEKRGYTANFKANAESGRTLPQADFSPGTVIGGAFKIVSVIGEGGMGIVYLAQHLSLNRQYALKVLSPSIVSEQSWLRFKAEAKTLSVLNHPGLVKVYDLGIHENTVPYYSMDYLEGETLEDLLVRKGPQELEFAISIFLAVLDALAYAHRNNVVHRDIKPANIFICQNQEIKILDFGISKLVGDKQSQRKQELTAIGEVFGSPYYMSPEQCRGEQIDFRSDIYSVGCTLFETLTGYVPFESANSLEIAMLHEEGEIPLLSDVCDIAFPPSLDVVIAKCLAKLPQDRYQSAKEMAIDLTRIKDGKSLEAYLGAARRHKNGSDEYEMEPIGGRFGAYAILSFLGLCLAAFALFIGFNQPQPPVPRMDVAELSEPRSAASATALLTELNAANDVDTLNSSLSPRSEAAVKAYLRQAPRFFSRVVVTSDGQKQKVFDFPKAVALGQLRWSDHKVRGVVHASGLVSVPATAACSFVTDNALTAHPELFGHFRNDDLIELVLEGAPPKTESALPFVSRLTALQMLSLRQVPLNADSFKHLNCLANLRKLSLESCPADSLSLSKLAALTNLEFLTLTDEENTSLLLQALSRRSNLVSLSLSQADLSREDIEAIASLKTLRSLTLRSRSVDNKYLEMLTALKNLEQLDVTRGALDEKCFDSLCKFPKLKVVRVPGVLGRGEFEARLKQARPQLRMFEWE